MAHAKRGSLVTALARVIQVGWEARATIVILLQQRAATAARNARIMQHAVTKMEWWCAVASVVLLAPTVPTVLRIIMVHHVILVPRARTVNVMTWRMVQGNACATPASKEPCVTHACPIATVLFAGSVLLVCSAIAMTI